MKKQRARNWAPYIKFVYIIILIWKIALESWAKRASPVYIIWLKYYFSNSFRYVLRFA